MVQRGRKRQHLIDGATLKQLRERKGFSLASFSAHLAQIKKEAEPDSLEASADPLNPSTLSRIETGKNGTTLASAALIAAALDVAPEVLAASSNESQNSDSQPPEAATAAPPSPSEHEPGVKLVGPISDRLFVDLPRVSVPARASFVEMCGSQADYPTLETQRIYVREAPAMYTTALLFDVDGDSMEPLIHSGDQVIAYRVPPEKWESLRNCVIVVSYSDTVTIKKVIENDLFKHQWLTLRPYRDELASHVVRLSEIHCVFRVEDILPRPKKSRL